MESIRLQKYMSDMGYCSRRKAEQFILQNRVKVNTEYAILGVKVNPKVDIVSIDGKIIKHKKIKHRYLALNKPRGYVTTMSDEKGRKCILDLVKNVGERVYPIGRLDLDSEGLILLTNDGSFANGIMHPRGSIFKKYRVTLSPVLDDTHVAHLMSGISIEGTKTLPAKVKVLSNSNDRSVMEISIKEGKNRQIRKMCEVLGLRVLKLKRVSIGPLELGALKLGTYRDLTAGEIKLIKDCIKI